MRMSRPAVRPERGRPARWARCAALVLLALIWWGSWPTPEAVAAADDCHPEQLTRATVDASTRLDYHERALAVVHGTVTVKVPRDWSHADDLLLSENSEPYRRALRCLLRDQGNRLYHRNDEWREKRPRTTAEGPWVTARYETLTWVQHRGRVETGPWVIDVGAHEWRLTLARPPALENAQWRGIEADVGGLDVLQFSPVPESAGNGKLVWGDPAGVHPPITMRIKVPWQRAWAASAATEPWKIASDAGLASLYLGASLVIVLAALRAPGHPTGETATELEKSAARWLLRWGLLSGAIGLVVLLLFPRWDGGRWEGVIGVLCGWALVFFARPRRSVALAASVVAVVGVLLESVPALFGLPGRLSLVNPPSGYGFTALVLVAVAVQWLWLAGLVAWAWRLAREGGMRWASVTPWRLSRTGAVLGLIAVLVVGWYVWAGEQAWKRVTWLSDQTSAEYDLRHLSDVANGLIGFPLPIPLWSYTHTWVLTGIGIAALLRARALARPEPWMGPVGVGQLLLATFFAVVVMARQVSISYAGNSALAGLWLVLGIVALYALLAVGRRLSVLTRPLEGVPVSPAVGETITEARHSELTDRARRYRELHTQLRQLDQGKNENGLTRHAVEQELDLLHRWRPPRGAPGMERPWLPSQVTVVDVALSWGPYTNWWDNARRAAFLAFCFGVPLSLVLVWSTNVNRPYWWMKVPKDPTGMPDLLWAFIGWQITWAGAGLVLGALWRLLPGRGGPVRALSLVITYGVLIGLATLGNRLTDQELGNAATYILTMMLVLTLTSLAMDADTFRCERHFWTSRVSLLLSIYQLRGFSTIIAWVLVQAIAVATLLNTFRNINPKNH